MTGAIIIITFFLVLSLGISAYSYWRSSTFKKNLEEQNKKMERRMYELAILKELGDRMGYSLNVQNIVDIITGSLHQFLEYSAVSYMLIEPEKIIFKAHLEESVSRSFIDEIKDRMTKSLSALLNKDLKKTSIEEVLSGSILVDEIQEPLRSFFNIPLVIGEKVVGVLTVAHTKEGLYKDEETTILYKITKQASDAVTRLQEVIKTEEKKLNAMVSSMSEGVVMTDKDYRIVVANPVAREIINQTDKEEVDIFDFIDNLGTKFDIRGKLEESVKLDKILTIKEVLINNKFYQIFISPVKSKYGLNKEQILGGVVIFHDITHDKELEHMREDFTSMMVHELRSPLDGIKKISKYIIKHKKYSADSEIQEYMSLVNGSSKNMLNLVNDLLDVAKLDVGKFEIDLVSANIKNIIEEQITFYKPVVSDKQVAIDFVIDKQVPEKINFDPVRISQVLKNLISNSIKFTDKDGHITIGAFMHTWGKSIIDEAKKAGIKWMVNFEDKKMDDFENAVIISVTDNGCGIDNNNISGLFDKFVQFQTTRKQDVAKGTGLGLAISKGIVEAHNGIIHVASEKNEGTTMYFAIPLKKIDI